MENLSNGKPSSKNIAIEKINRIGKEIAKKNKANILSIKDFIKKLVP